MERRRLGSSALDVSAIGLGCMSMSGAYGPGDDAQSIAVVHRALDLGVNFIDSSDMYGWGHNEELLAKALRGKRDRVVLATKFGNLRKPDGTRRSPFGERNGEAPANGNGNGNGAQSTPEVVLDEASDDFSSDAEGVVAGPGR